MRSSDFLLPFLVSAGIHAGLLVPGLSSQDARVASVDEPARVILNIIPPAISEASEDTADAVVPVQHASRAAPEQAQRPRSEPNREKPHVSAEPPARASESAAPPEPIVSRPTPAAVDVDEAYAAEKPTADEVRQPVGERDATQDSVAQDTAGPEPAIRAVGPSGPRAHTASLATGSGRARPGSVPGARVGEGATATASASGVPSPSSPPPGRVMPDPVEPPEPIAHPKPRAGPAADGDLEGDGGAVAAQVRGVSKPRYPSLSRRRNEEGRVVLAVEIRADGAHGSIEIVQSSGHSRLDHAAVQALKRAKFIPAKKGGERVTSTKQVAFTFRLVDAED